MKLKSKDRSLNFLIVSSVFMMVLFSISNYYCENFSIIEQDIYLFACSIKSISIIAFPILFLVGGAILLNKPINFTKYKTNIKKMILFIIFWTFIYYLWNHFVQGENSNLILVAVEGFFKPIDEVLGILYIFLTIYLTLPLIELITLNMTIKHENLFLNLWLFFSGTVYLITIILNLSNLDLNVMYQIPIVQGTYYLGYFIVGHIIYKRLKEKEYDHIYNKYFIICALVGIFITIAGSFILSICENQYFEHFFSNQSLFVMISSISIYVLFINNGNKLFKNKKFNHIIGKIAPYSLSIYLIHPLLVDLSIKYSLLNYLNPYISVLSNLIIIYLVSYLISYLIRKVPYIRNFV